MIIPIDRFFQEMELSDDEKKRREDLAEEMLVLFLLLFSEIKADRELGNEIDADYYKDMLYRQYCDNAETYIVLFLAVSGRKNISKEMKEYIRERVSDMVDTTLKHTDDFYTSNDRAIMLAENETNFVGNSTGYSVAKYQGYRHKKWITMKDEKVRLSHVMVDEEVKEIDEYYQVGLAEMLFPLDMSRNAAEHPEETIGCRCSIAYIK